MGLIEFPSGGEWSGGVSFPKGAFAPVSIRDKRPMTDEIKAFPEYPSKHQGVALIVGAAPTAYRELALAKERLPVTPYIIAVNFMADRIECQAMVTCEKWVLIKVNPFVEPEPITHLYPSDQRQVSKTPPPLADHIWHGPPAAAGSASLGAALIAKAIGFSDIILCGVPIDASGYLDGYPVIPEGSHFESGDMVHQRALWKKYQKIGMLTGVTSFNGYTKDLLGPPEFKEAA